ncbi:uncharacterized protein SPPG_03635 [Spizellomyces punctatus DAOM BR117]|uniref:Radial spokehead-like protein n=1 Tax=Spizellomyces punctatus (strain DAOM BR117) TaxID=645134 RepID=A0A0L0HLR3_SPIPD|nr:uncharacterized protein SPPG_03635 [Spizellomyces punctatus DAOM BR117]KND01845.1 hypothetical protein SPPG_03635 [Spizellomyces punctatus DAOM BR117]|eukprot:XP_016609884.1 hypothetical protein SPPG_03635 [Spizellomyces punctatus DAOM BR117]
MEEDPVELVVPEPIPEPTPSAPPEEVEKEEQPAQPTPPAEPTTAAPPQHPFLDRKDFYIPPASRLPEGSELALAKAFLMTQSEKSNLNLYDHLTEVIVRILETRPGNVVDAFETLSADIKRSHFVVDRPNAPGAFQKASEVAPANEIGAAQVKLFEKSGLEEPGDPEAFGEIPDIMDLSNLWEWAGVSLGKEETFMLFLSLKSLVTSKPLQSVRLWGKILGAKANYLIIEGELKEGAVDEDAPQVEEEVQENAEEKKEAEEDEDVPKRKEKPVIPLPREERVGVNKYVYYVCNYAGGPWTRLPDVIPEKLQASRRIRKFFTGDLNHKIVSYPPFNDTEAQYLRCQIARISAATVVSPSGYYTFDQEDENEDEENPQPQNIIINPEFESLSPEQLIDPANWVHHVPYILPQGRVTWENPLGQKGEEEANEDEDEEEGSDAGEGEEERENVEPETGPGILSPLSSDEGP